MTAKLCRAISFATVLLITWQICLLPAQSATIAGTKCNKIAATKTVANINYTCVKSGKTLVWNKGVKVKSATTPKPNPSLSPSPRPGSIEEVSKIKAGDQCTSADRGRTRTTPAGTFICKHDGSSAFRWFVTEPTSTSVAPSTTPVPKPTGPASPITLDNLDPEWTSIVAYSRMQEFAKSQLKPNVDKTLLLSPTVESRPYRLYIQGLDEAVSSLAQIYKSPKFTVILFTELDSEWIDQTQTRLMGNYLNNPKEQLQSNRLKQSGCNIGGFYLPNIILFCVKDQTTLDKSISSTYSAAHSFAHEYFHLSGFISPDFTTIPILGTDSTANRRFKSCWIDEGFATFYGFAYGGSLIDESTRGRLAFLNELTYSYDFRRNQKVGTIKRLLLENDPKIVTKLYKEVEGTLENCPDTQNGYFLGELAAEALVASFGAKSLNDFQIEFGRTGDWKASFEKIFGLKVDDFYIKMTPYLTSQARKFPN